MTLRDYRILIEVIGLGLGILGQALLLNGPPKEFVLDPIHTFEIRVHDNEQYPHQLKLYKTGIWLTLLGFAILLVGAFIPQ